MCKPGTWAETARISRFGSNYVATWGLAPWEFQRLWVKWRQLRLWFCSVSIQDPQIPGFATHTGPTCCICVASCTTILARREQHWHFRVLTVYLKSECDHSSLVFCFRNFLKAWLQREPLQFEHRWASFPRTKTLWFRRCQSHTAFGQTKSWRLWGKEVGPTNSSFTDYPEPGK